MHNEIYSYELYHHGIKGMKWGVRRFQNKDGSLTNAGKKRYSEAEKTDAKTKVTHRSILEKKYRDLGMREDEAKAAADKRIKMEKTIAIVAGLTVTACAANYARNKYASTYCDQVLKAGTTFHNLDSTANPRPGEHLYVNYRQNDVNYFRGHFAVNKMRKTGQVFNHTLTANEDIKIPSLNTRKSVFKQLYDNDADFRKAFNSYSGHGDGADKYSANKVYKNMWRNFGDKDNEQFTIAKRKYFDALRQKGYEAIVDEWDTSPRVFRSDAPLILLNTSSKSFGEMSIKELTSRDILLSQANSKYYRLNRDTLTSIGAPHTNHFKESTRHLSRYNVKNQRNSENINKILSQLSDEQINKHVKSRDGAVLSNAGKLLSKHKNMTTDTALARAKTNKQMIDATAATGGLAIMYAPVAGLHKAESVKYARNYLSDNPNTKLTYKQISKMSRYDDKIRQYQEKHPNTKLTNAQILKLYYGT